MPWWAWFSLGLFCGGVWMLLVLMALVSNYVKVWPE